MNTLPPQAQDRVLSTLNNDGSRRKVRPQLANGVWLKRRFWLAWSLIGLFVALPFLQIKGKPAVLLDLPARTFTFFGATLRPTDSQLLMVVMLAIFLTIFVLTALFGRVWCGWGCPQTVYMEFVFRPIERLFEGNRSAQLQRDERGGWDARRIAKFGVYAVLSVVVAHIFLAYFVPVSVLHLWMLQEPSKHPAGFGAVLATSALMFFDFAYFREQMCVVICPYARLQSALLDRQSLVVAYDAKRGEPRGKLSKIKTSDLSIGDCIDCKACVTTCPTGIDIRDGLQMECLSCTQCIDACDNVMAKIHRPRGLIRYSSQAALAGEKPKPFRVRVALYVLGLLALGGVFALFVQQRGSAEITVLRGIGAPFTVQADGNVNNQVRIKIYNHSGKKRSYAISLENTEGVQFIAPENPLRVGSGETRTTSTFAIVARQQLRDGEKSIVIEVDDGQGAIRHLPFELLGPKER